MHATDWITTTSYGIGGITFLVFGGVLIIANRKDHPLGSLLLWASLTSAIWMLLLAYWPHHPHTPLYIVTAAEALSNSAWLFLIGRLLVGYKSQSPWRQTPVWVAIAAPLIWFLATIATIYSSPSINTTSIFVNAQETFIPGGLTLAIIGLVMLEQIWRNVVPEDRWSLKYLCIGIGVQLTYNLLLYSEAMLYHDINSILWGARGAVFALTVPLLLISFFRNKKWPGSLLISRRIAFHSATLIAAGAYLLIVAGGGFYIRDFGGSWASFWETLFIAAASILLLSLMVSEQIRARIRVFLSKNFFTYKYDYREEWNRLTNLLYRHSSTNGLPYERVIQAAAEIVDSVGGALWTLQGSPPSYRLVASSNLHIPDQDGASFDTSFIAFMTSGDWIITADSSRSDHGKHPAGKPPAWLKHVQNWWLIIPLVLKPDLVGILILARPRIPRSLTWEDWDLLKTVGQQLAAYLSQYEANQSLSQSRQFQAVHQLSIFLMHDLKNLIAQQSLLVSNAAKHKHNPAFIDDMIATIEDSVQRMTQTLGQLQGRETVGLKRRVLVYEFVNKAVKNCEDRQPSPVLELDRKQIGTASSLSVMCDPLALVNVLVHMIRNAQDATPDTGSIRVKLVAKKNRITISVIDNGVGMTPQFIRERLFKPFDTTKSAKGMGIGAYQAQSFARQYGGDVEVESVPGYGTRFHLWLPEADETSMTSSEVST
ncbi:hypothetical protein BJI67_07000 [Acidihalobacter aeolianus]|uniref:histidine kinase n=1 Tax=Acidihalobacter aeolianus TaxID=2792603 RepID=A0A1D8K7A7_9GAMM|nr:XrtA/PEP-CTERM system histidine kinase PrsK [Acidihalobacter aeolianus]AOV16841.1 hypothetical protein BJI67_07000 [Acidihalobacter aeolianus]